MKKIFLVVFSLLLLASISYAQDAEKDMKKAARYLSSYNLDPAANPGKLQESYQLITSALNDTIVSSTSRGWILKGKILNELAAEEVKKKLIDPKYVITMPDAATEAALALKKGIQLSVKKHEAKEALTALLDTENHLNNFGIYAFQEKDYKVAFINFDMAADVYLWMKDNESEETSRLADPAIRSEHFFYTGIAGFYGDNKADAAPYFEELYKNGSKEPFVYEALFSIYESDEEKALVYLNKGRELFPSNSGLLFAEINHYVRKGEMEKMIDKLESALEIEPDNVSIYTTLGSVYDQLCTKATEADDKEKAKECFDKSLSYFNQALKLEPNYFDAIYSIGALYYNSAANMTKELNKYANDYSKEGTKKYNEIKSSMDALFDQALPYFEKAEGINSNDAGVLQALSEIYARKNILDKAQQYKDRLDSIQSK
ncbi:MAG TPA: hypothetical protein DCQ58_06370 [Saprospirales bacterium]|nr:hypothetical protein [Saprospirales bacterium]